MEFAYFYTIGNDTSVVRNLITVFGARYNPVWRAEMNEAAREAYRLANAENDEIMRQYERLNNILDAFIEWNPGNQTLGKIKS